MTRLQRVLNKLGAWRFQRFRRWVGGPWRERYIDATPHSSECPYFRWEPYGALTLNELLVRAALGPDSPQFEMWPVKPPIAHAITRDRKS